MATTSSSSKLGRILARLRGRSPLVLVPVAMAVFDRVMPGPNQLDRPGFQEEIGADDLLRLPGGSITEAGVRNNVSNISVTVDHMDFEINRMSHDIDRMSKPARRMNDIFPFP